MGHVCPVARKTYHRAHRQSRLDWLHDQKRKPCSDCGGTFNPFAMQFHHRDPATKEFHIGRSVTVSRSRLIAEIAKCELLCANCHAIRTHSG